jgi:hypothetical protein
MFHALMGRFQLELLLFITYFSDFRYAEGKSKSPEQIFKEGLQMKTIEETMSIIHLEKKP